MSELDALLARLEQQDQPAPVQSPAAFSPQDGINPATGRMRLTVTPRPDTPPPVGETPPSGLPGPAKGRQLDARSRELAIRTILGEAAGEGPQGMQAVARVLLNRLDAGRWGDSIPKVVAAKGQFEPWMTQAGRTRMYRYTPDSPEYRAASAALDAAISGEDITQGATHFYAPRVNAALAQKDGRKPVPDWAQGNPLTVIGGHQFFAPDRQPQKPSTGPGKSPAQVLSEVSSGKSPEQPQMMSFAQPQPAPPPFEIKPAAAAVAQTRPGALDQLLSQLNEQPPAPPPGAIIHNADGTSTVAGTDVSAKRPTGGGEREMAASMEALKQRAAGRDLGPMRHALPAFEGYSLNFGDEAVSSLAGMIAKARGGNFQDAYDTAQQIFKQEMEREQAEHPVASTVGEVAGAITNPIARLGGRGNTLWQRMLSNAKAAGLLSAISGAGSGEGVGDRAAKGTIGGAVGFVAGGALTPIAEGAAKAASIAVAKPAEIARRAWNPAGAAERLTAAEKAAAERVDPKAANRLFDHEITPGGPGAMIDTMGDQGRKLARTVRNVSPEAEHELNNLLQPRYAQQAARIVDWFDRKFGFPSTKALEDAIDAAERGTNSVRYKAAYAAGDKPVSSQKLLDLMGSDDVYEAMRRAVKNWRTHAIADGYGGMNAPFRVTADGRLEMLRKPNGVPVFPNLQFWDYVRREISGMARSGDNASKQGALKRIAADMNTELDKLVPAYEAARKGAASFFKAENALEAGENFFKSKGQYALDEAAQALRRMNPAERKLFRAGFANAMKDQLKDAGFRQDVVKRFLNSQGAVDRARLALGSQGTREMQAVLRVEGIMQQALEAVRGNSTTMAQIAGAAAFEGGDPTGNMIGNMSMGAVVGHLLAKGNNALNRRVAEHVAKLLTSRDPAAIQRVASMAMRNRRLWNALTDVERQLVSGSTSRAVPTATPGIQSLVPVRAEDQQPDVDRPRGE